MAAYMEAALPSVILVIITEAFWSPFIRDFHEGDSQRQHFSGLFN